MAEAGAAGRRGRLAPDERRRQLVGIGLRMLTEVPIHELSVDRVAAEAGISRGLLFHYFPSKRDFYLAVVRAAARRLLRACAPDPEAAPDEQLRQLLGGYVDFLARRREPYLALFRGSAGGADYVREIYQQTREVFADRTLSALGRPDPPPAVALVVRSWFCFVEDAALAWTVDRHLDRDDFIEMLVRALHALIDATTPAPGGR